MLTSHKLELRAWIWNRGKYNEGELVGEWVTFPVDDDEWNDVLARIGLDHEDPETGEMVRTGYDEHYVADYDGGPDWYSYFGEWPGLDWLNETAENLEYWQNDEDLFYAALEYDGDIGRVLDSSPDYWMLLSNVIDDYDLGLYYAQEVNCVDFGENGMLERYFNYERYGRDIRLDSDGDFTKYGWVERLR